MPDIAKLKKKCYTMQSLSNVSSLVFGWKIALKIVDIG